MRVRFAGFSTILASLAFGAGRPAVAAAQEPIAFVVAPSASTLREARRMLRFCRWTDTTVLRSADFALVVVRSSESQPLSPSYASLKWLRDAANSQQSELGAQFHVYLYTIREDLSFLQASHRSYDVNPTGTLTSSPTIPPPSDPARILFSCG
jgi:hypothetical protein